MLERLPRAGRRDVSVEALALGASLYLTLVANGAVWARVLDGRDLTAPSTWRFVAALGAALTALQFAALALVLTRRTARLVLAVLLLVAAAASHFMGHYGVLLDPGMLRNVLHTDAREAGELLDGALAWRLTWQAGLPALVVWRLAPAHRPWPRALGRRLAWLIAALAVAVGATAVVFQDMAALARNHREWRFLVNPANVVYSLAKTAAATTRTAASPRLPMGRDAVAGPARARPALVVLVVGETVRAANWGLAGYSRQTTPQLAAVPGLVSFADVQACGTDTDTSLPCMFSPWGRRDFDDTRMRRHESLLHLLQHAGLGVSWLDNQSGCKGVCDGLPMRRVDPRQASPLCDGQRCFDEVLLDGLKAPASGTQVLVLHGLGSHGPAYHRRYPPAFGRFQPACASDELHRCSREQIVNAYDNSVLYTDHVLAQAIGRLQAMNGVDTALLYVSDHGESLGERGLFLHGLPHAIAPREQTVVPMVWWLSPGYVERLGVDRGCLARAASQPASHDHLFHSVLGLLEVRTGVRDVGHDLVTPCRAVPAAREGDAMPG